MNKGLLAVMLLVSIASAGFGEVELAGSLRNDAILLKTTNAYSFNNILENKLTFSRRTDDWRFYSDLRIDLLYGDIARQNIRFALSPTVIINTNIMINYNVSLMRMFLRYNSSVGDFTLGKTYVNFGSPGVFNPFEVSKSVNFNDLKADKEGIFALLYDLAFNELSGGKMYLSPSSDLTNGAAGLSIYGNIAGFDAGLVYNRKAINTNLAGLYVKGDLEVGVNASWAFHFDDYYTNCYQEASAGIDYSFFDGKLVTALSVYFDERGANNTNDYKILGSFDRYFNAMYYVYGNAMYSVDEFLSLQFNVFCNLVDGSGLLMPMASYALADGLNLSLQAGFITGVESQEFSRDKLGEYSVLIRLEGKL